MADVDAAVVVAALACAPPVSTPTEGIAVSAGADDTLSEA